MLDGRYLFRRRLWHLPIIVLILLPAISFMTSPGRATTLASHPPILIDGNRNFSSSNGVTGGSGSPSDPFIISAWDITFTCEFSECGYKSAIEIRNTNAQFIIRNVNVHPQYLYARGISLVNVTNGLVQSVAASGPQYGILIDHSANIAISAVKESGSGGIENEGGAGLTIGYSNNISVGESDFSGNIPIGVSASATRGLVIENNTISRNSGRYGQGWGIQFFQVADARITGNNITDNGWEAGYVNGRGIELYYSSDTVISNNNVSCCLGYGIGVRLYSSERIATFHNNFAGFWMQAVDDLGDRNFWDDGYPSGGNYWSGLSTIDTCSGPNQDVCPDSDGIADVVHSIPGSSGSVDQYPLTKHFAPTVSGTLKIQPALISLQRSTGYLTARIALPQNLNSSNLTRSSIRLNATIMPVRIVYTSQPIGGQILAKFNVTQAEDLMSTPGSYVLQVSGNILTNKNFIPFVAFDTIRVRS